MDGILSNKRTITGIVTGLAIGLLFMVLFTAGFGLNECVESIGSFSWMFLIAGLSVYVIKWFVETVSFKIATSKFMNITFKNCFKTTMATQFVNLVTPFMSGGQLATVYVLNKSGMKIEKATSAMIIKSLMFQTFVTFFAFISLFSLLGELTLGAKIAATTGIVLNMAIIIMIMVIGIKKTVAKSITAFVIFILEKIRLINLSDEKRIQIYDNIEEFNNAFDTFKNDWKRLLKLFFLNGIQFSLFTLSSMIVLKGFGFDFGLRNFFRIFLISASSLSVPTPGTSGGAEGLYYLFMNQTIPDEKIAASIIIWRLCTYYIPLLMTGFFSFYCITKASRRGKTNR